MNRRVRKCITGFVAACIISVAAPVLSLEAYAATARISFSDPSATVGQEFNVTVKISSSDGSLGASDVMLSYDPSCIEFVSGNNASGGAGSVRLVGTMDSNTTTEFSYTLKFKAVQAGNTAISVGNYEVYDVDTQAVNVTKVGSSAVKVNAPATYSSEAALSSLKVSPGQLSPAFSPDVTSYSVSVGGDVEKLAVSAVTKDGKAKVRVNGESGLKVGANTVVCKVTAEDGQTTKTYTLTVNKSESAEVPSEAAGEVTATGEAVLGGQTVDVDGVQYTVASSFDPAILPEGYVSSTCTYGGAEVMCGSGNGLNLLYLQDAEGNGSLFVYIPESGALSPYVTIDVTAKSVLVLPPDDSVEIPEGFAQTTIQLNGNYKVNGWVWETDTDQNYCVIYGMNENGEKGLYRYDITEKTFQRYFKDPALSSKYDDAAVEDLYQKYESLRKDYNLRFIVIVALIVVSLILFFMVVNLLLRKREHSGDDRPGREEAPTPVKRRAMEEESRNRRQTAGKTASGKPADRTGGGNRPPVGSTSKNRGADPYDSSGSGRKAADSHERGRADFREGGRVPRRETESYARNSSAKRSADPYERGSSAKREADLYGRSNTVNREANSREKSSARRENDPYGRGNSAGRDGGAYGAGFYDRPVSEKNSAPYGGSGAGRRPISREGAERAREPYHGSSVSERKTDARERVSSDRRTDGDYGRSMSGAGERMSYERQTTAKRAADPYADRYDSSERERMRMRDAGMEEAIRQRELDRAERARRTRERLERERLEDERRARAARRETAAGRSPSGDDDDFEFLDLD